MKRVKPLAAGLLFGVITSGVWAAGPRTCPVLDLSTTRGCPPSV